MGLRLACAGLALLSLGTIASAQTKVAVINLQRAVLESAEIKKADAAMQAKYKPKQTVLEQLEKDISGIAQQLQTNTKLTPQAQADLQAQGTRKQRERDRLAQDLQDEVTAERNDILAKSTQKMSEVVKKIAEEKGFDLVVDVSNTVYFKAAMEITNDAIAAFDKAYPAK
jgi:outer membrane protein